MIRWVARTGRVIGKGVVVAYCYRFPHEKPNSVDIRNAKFIALAPALLESLKELLTETDQHATGDCKRLLEACKTARTLIAKAERLQVKND
jgi:hypothetical protein